MVNVDGLAIQLATQLRREHLHVARKDHQFRAGVFHHLPHLTLLGRFVIGVEGELDSELFKRTALLVVGLLDDGVLTENRLAVIRNMLYADSGLQNNPVEAICRLIDREGYRQQGGTKDEMLSQILATVKLDSGKLDQVLETLSK